MKTYKLTFLEPWGIETFTITKLPDGTFEVEEHTPVETYK